MTQPYFLFLNCIIEKNLLERGNNMIVLTEDEVRSISNVKWDESVEHRRLLPKDRYPGNINNIKRSNGDADEFGINLFYIGHQKYDDNKDRSYFWKSYNKNASETHAVLELYKMKDGFDLWICETLGKSYLSKNNDERVARTKGDCKYVIKGLQTIYEVREYVSKFSEIWCSISCGLID